MITDKQHYLECPAYDHVTGDMCGQKSFIVSERRNHIFKCPDHGRFKIDEDGNPVD